MNPNKNGQRRLLSPHIFLVVTLIAGFFLTWFLYETGMARLETDARVSVSVISKAISQSVQHVNAAVNSLAGSPWIAPALTANDALDIQRANAVLDRYQTRFGYEICYLMDKNGVVIASSDREKSNTLLGKNYAFRSYFQEAIKGKLSFYAAFGVTSKSRGFYVGNPVKGAGGEILGVVVIKEKIQDIKDILTSSNLVFYISPEGIIFISSIPELALRSLWPITSADLDEIRTNQQFGPGPFLPVFPERFRDGENVRFRGNEFRCSMTPLAQRGWQLVYLSSMSVPNQYFWFGILITVFACGLAISFIIWTWRRDKDLARVRESERKYQALFEFSQDAIMTLAPPDWKFTSANTSTIKMFRFKNEPEFLDRGPWELSPELQPDGQFSAKKAMEMIQKAMRDGSNFFEWTHKRADGESFPATVLLARMEWEGRELLQATVRDITAQKAAEAQIKTKMEELAKFNRIAVGRELKMIELKEKIKSLQEGKQ